MALAVGLVENDLALEERADGFVGEVADFVVSRGDGGGEEFAVDVRNMLADELAHVHPHLVAGLEGLLHLVSLPARPIV